MASQGGVAAAKQLHGKELSYNNIVDADAARQAVTAIIQPGGSIRDEEAIKVADDHGLAMVFTNMRHFRH